MTDRLILTLAILGGTGNEGKGLAYRWAKAGYHVIIGSRQAEKAQRIAEELNERIGRDVIQGMANQDAARWCDIAVLTAPYSAHASTLEGIKDLVQGKVLVDVTVPLVPPKVSTLHVPDDGSAAQEAQRILGENVQVVAAFQNVSFAHLQEDQPVPCDVLVCGRSSQARTQVLQLVKAAGMVGWDAGALENAIVVEGLTSILIGITLRHKIEHPGIRITGEQPLEEV
ncbi:MAG: NADPH-dependent F420 reductase [Anaerolineales bacterium]|nr:NADPH-dependent F420 reductase [Anaerolineales bacterium]